MFEETPYPLHKQQHDKIFFRIESSGKESVNFTFLCTLILKVLLPFLQATLTNLKDVLFLGNPMYEELPDRAEARIRVIAHLPQVTKVDGELVKPSDIEAAKGIELE